MNSLESPHGLPSSFPSAIGIVGGVGPRVDALLLSKVMNKQTGLCSDQGAIPILLGQYACLIGDRTEYLDSLGTNQPLVNPALGAARVAGLLVSAGVTVLGVPCSTFHAEPIFRCFETEMQHHFNVRIVDMVQRTLADIVRRERPGARIGLLSTSGTARYEVYAKPLRAHGFVPLELDSLNQEKVHRAIYDPVWGIKARDGQDGYFRARTILMDGALSLVQSGADAVLLGCTEIPLVIDTVNVPVYDPLDSLAEGLVDAFMAASTLGTSQTQSF